MTNKQALVCDTSILLYLGRIGHSHLLPALFAPVYIPEQVVWELDAGRSLRPDTINPRTLNWGSPTEIPPAAIEQLPSSRLGQGEKAVVALALVNKIPFVGLDDLQARVFAETLSLKTVGSIGIIIRAKKAGLVPKAQPLLDALQKNGFYLSAALYKKALQLSGE